MISCDAVLPLALAYAQHIGLEADPAEMREDLRKRLSLMPPWARASLAAGAFLVRRLSPGLMIGKWRSFESLEEGERERLLERLRSSASPAVRIAFLGLRSLILAACYGRGNWPPGNP